ncbi:MAG: class I SAM-dependent methyltransferase [Myxococcota bacterium]
MIEGQPSQTALATAALRAAHRLHDRPVVFDDPLARDLTSDEWRAQLDAGAMPRVVAQLGLRPIQGQLVGRARHVDDRLDRAIADAGAAQVVLLGAGLDSLAWRRPSLGVRVIELDHPATQAWKRERLAELALDGAVDVALVPVDFEREAVDAALARAGFDRGAPAFFAWMGVVGYLAPASRRATLAGVARCAAAGSRVVFDYPAALEALDDDTRAIARRVDEGTASLGEARIGRPHPAALESEARELGFDVVEHLGPADLAARYFAGRDDDLGPNPETRIVELALR